MFYPSSQVCLFARGTRALTSSSVHTDVDPGMLNTRDRSLRSTEVDLERAESTLDRLASARGMLFTVIAGSFVWITLITLTYFILDRLGW